MKMNLTEDKRKTPERFSRKDFPFVSYKKHMKVLVSREKVGNLGFPGKAA